MEFLKAAFSALPNVAAHPLSFVAYVLVVAAWVIISLKVKRNKQVLEHLDKIPEKSRLEVLRMEMGAVRLKSGLTPEQWIKSRIHLYYFLGFAILCLVAVIIFVVAMTTGKKEGTINSGIVIDQDELPALVSGTAAEQPAGGHEPTEYKVINAYDGSGVPRKLKDSDGVPVDFKRPLDLTLKYSYERMKEGVWIKPDMPYLSLLAKGGPITTIFDEIPFLWQFPKLSVKVVNNTDRTVELDEAAIEVVKSTINREPVLMIGHGASLIFSNQGWGDVHKPQVRYGVTKGEGCEKLDVDKTPTSQTKTLPAFSDQSEAIEFDYESVKNLMDEGDDVCVYGEIKYTTDEGNARAVKFKVRVNLEGLGDAGEDKPVYFYDASLPAGEAGYTRRVPLTHKHTIKPGEVDHFVIRIATNKSAQFELKFSFRDVGGMEIPTDNVLLDIFVPRTEIKLIAKKPGAQAGFVARKST